MNIEETPKTRAKAKTLNFKTRIRNQLISISLKSF